MALWGAHGGVEKMSLSIEDQHRNARKLCMEVESRYSPLPSLPPPSPAPFPTSSQRRHLSLTSRPNPHCRLHGITTMAPAEQNEALMGAKIALDSVKGLLVTSLTLPLPPPFPRPLTPSPCWKEGAKRGGRRRPTWTG